VRRLQVLRNGDLEPIPDKKIVKYTDMGNIKEIMYIEKLNRKGLDIKKINKDEYIIISTGEVLEFKHTENRSQNVDALRVTFKKIRQLINYNFGGKSNELAFTITYKENMMDPKRLYKDFEKFIKRLRYKYHDAEYLSVVEPQERGSWHCHVLLKFLEHEKIYIPNKEIADTWGHGFVTVKAIKKDVDNLGAYLSAYLGDVELNEKTDLSALVEAGALKLHKTLNIKEVEVDGKTKKFIKGARLYLYPSGMNIYRCSRGIKEPESTYLPYKKVKKIVGAVTPNYSKRIKILDDNGNIVNSITYEQYNMKRVKNNMELNGKAE
jgi:hypothetical protein